MFFLGRGVREELVSFLYVFSITLALKFQATFRGKISMEELATILENTEKMDEMIAESLLQLLSNQFTYYEIAIVKLYLMHYICRLVS